ncbi:MAG: glutathione S-transferase [Sneathiella sp.]|jgi:glutathione S-transferase|uniref:glutathione S-transferase family protein n=1 Tax=Sneathiella sp. TaxID=1964365 RepID=UPI000C357494|nr:glutathione S-transferase family protein [Sneathiella sp.]MAL78037.1 glutathione S-transferase [Sneathiella sp.]|tara:strand:+ start:83 stop:703 length:621 start_codon:yes stop_codon:yes gene_type:complete
MLKLYYGPGTVAIASHLALAEAGADYEAIEVDFANAAQTKPDYLAINPKGRVPALVTERGILTETPAILLYIAQRYPEKNLAPLDDIHRLAEMQAFNSYLCSTVHVNHAHRMRGPRWASEESSFEDMRRKVKGNMEACLTLIQSDMYKGPWIMGETFTVADCYFFAIYRWLEGDKVDINDYPKLADLIKRMQERPAVKRVLAELGG